MSALRWVASVLWELPQTALGAGLYLAHAAAGAVRSRVVERGRLFVEVPYAAISLGHFVFWRPPADDRWFVLDDNVRAHEYGHTFQSRALGPLYLPLVGVPSSARAAYAVLYRELTGTRWEGYYNGYPERQADAYGGVVR